MSHSYRLATSLVLLLASAAQAEDTVVADAEPTQLDTVIVTGHAPTGYAEKSAGTATKTDTPLMETPAAVAVVPSSVLEDQRITRLQEALENVSGVRSNNTDVEGYVYKLRGFSSLNLFRNGLALPYTIATIEDTANVERIEVLKGPASILFGRVDPGGVINLVTKQPLDKPQYAVSQELGSYQHTRTQWDAGGPLGTDTGLSYRLSGAYQDEESFRDFQGGHRVIVAPVLGYAIGDDTHLTIDTQYMKNVAQSDTGFPALGTKPAPIPLSRSFQEANDPRDHTESYNLGYEFRHRFSDDWSVTNRFLYTSGRLWKLNVYPTAFEADGHTLDRTTQFQQLDGAVVSTNLDLAGHFTALNAEHSVLVGLDYLHDYYDYVYAEAADNFPIDIFQPQYGTVPASAYQDALNGVGYRGYSSVLVKQKGLYVQDQITWFDRLHLLLGGRFDDARVVAGRAPESKQAAIDVRHQTEADKDSQFSPRAGVLYQFTPELSGYVSYSQSFGVNNGRSSTGGRFPPEKGVQYEVGTKAQVLEGLTATVALFQLTKKNVLTPDLSTPDPEDSIAVGEIRSRGVELDMLGKLSSRLSLIGAYAYTDASVTRDDSGLEGKRLDNAPRHSGRLFANYDFGDGDGDGDLGWRAGGGFYAAAHAAGDKQNSFVLPGYATLDAFAGYTGQWGGARWTAQLNLDNLLNKDYFTGADSFYNTSSRLGLFAAAPFTAMGSLKIEWAP